MVKYIVIDWKINKIMQTGDYSKVDHLRRNPQFTVIDADTGVVLDSNIPDRPLPILTGYENQS